MTRKNKVCNLCGRNQFPFTVDGRACDDCISEAIEIGLIALYHAKRGR